MQPILVNLVDNAHRHGRPPVVVRVERGDDDVVVSVEDSGPGVPVEQREAIFSRVPLAGQDGEAAGAGLSIVRGVVAALRGSVWVDDAPSGGAAFRISLPIEHPKSPALPAANL